MKANDIQNTIIDLFVQYTGKSPDETIALPRSGSDRMYFRLKNNDISIIGAFNADIQENEAFFSFTETFRDVEIKVPEIYMIDSTRRMYLQQDLGTETLFDLLKKEDSQRLCHIKKTLFELTRIQIETAQKINFEVCYPRKSFDYRSIMWDLNYFKYEFLKIAEINFNEELLETDFENIAKHLTREKHTYFMYRDFQSRNVMWHNDEPWFIDYQGGRKGPLQYDVASLLFSPKSGLNAIEREALLDFYKKELENNIPIPPSFDDDYYLISLLRIVQALGAYGFRGIIENKPNFKSSIPMAIANLQEIITRHKPALDLPELYTVIEKLIESDWAKPNKLDAEKLTIRIISFSYKKRIPMDPSENGGGFVIDCRGIPNPGRYQEYKKLSGLDTQVIEYLEQYTEVHQFSDSIKQMLQIPIKNYIERKFNHLCIYFGCTGGQHRSVYNAQKTAEWIENNFPVNIVLMHNEKQNWSNE